MAFKTLNEFIDQQNMRRERLRLARRASMIGTASVEAAEKADEIESVQVIIPRGSREETREGLKTKLIQVPGRDRKLGFIGLLDMSSHRTIRSVQLVAEDYEPDSLVYAKVSDVTGYPLEYIDDPDNPPTLEELVTRDREVVNITETIAPSFGVDPFSSEFVPKQQVYQDSLQPQISTLT